MRTFQRKHPLQSLRHRLKQDFSEDLPPRVFPMPRWCREPQFFPGASGLPTESTWGEVRPGALPEINLGSVACESMAPDVTGRDVFVLGNFQSTVEQYSRVVAGLSSFEVTWRELRFLMSSVEPKRTFLTNAHIGLLEATKPTANFPTTPSYRARCAALLELELELFRPRVVVCLGAPAARLLAEVVSGAESWKPWPGYSGLQINETQRITVGISELRFEALAIRHPSAVVSRSDRRREARLIETAANS